MSFDLPPGMPVVVTPPHFAFGIGIINCANPVIGKLVRMRSKLIDAYGGSTFYETRDLCAYETCVPHHPLVKGA